MKKSSEKRGRFACFLIALLFVATAMAGILQSGLSAAPQPSALPASTTISGDVTVGTGYSLTSWTLSGGSEIMQGNLTVSSGGTVTLSNESLVFDQFSSSNSRAGYEAATIYHITVQDGGKLVLYHSTITTDLKTLNAIPVLGVIVQDSGTLGMYDNSSLMFPGQIIVSSANLTVVHSSITGIPASSFSSNYINETVFPVGLFDNPAVVSLFAANVSMQNSRMSIFQNNTTGTQANPAHVFAESYPFASDTGSKNTVQYTLEGVPTVKNSGLFVPDTTSYQSISNVSAFDSSYYAVPAGKTLALTGFDTSGITSTLQAASLHVSYKSQGSASGTLYWSYGNLSAIEGQVNLPVSTFGNNVSINLPSSLTVNDLSRVLAWVNGTGSSLLVNKVWVEFTFNGNAYKNLTVGGSSTFTAVDSFVGANFSPSPAHHTAVVTSDTGHAYFYNVQIDQSATANSAQMYSSAFFGQFGAMTAKPLSFGPLNTGPGGNSLALVDSNGGTYYSIPLNGVFQTFGTNVTSDSTVNTGLSTATLSISSDSVSGASVEIGEIGQAGLVNTGITLSAGVGQTYTANIYKLGFTTLADISNLVVYIKNGGSSTTDVKNINVQVQLLPQIYVYRFANVTVYSSQGLPVQGSSIASYYTGTTPDNVSSGSPAGYFVGPGNTYQIVPPAVVLAALGRTAANYNVTNQFGSAMIPLLTDVIDASTYPDSVFTGNYSAVVTYNGSSYGNSISFSPYPIITEQSLLVDFNITIGVTLPLPQIEVGRPYVVPSFLYVNQSGTVWFNVTDSGSTGVSSLPINVTDGANGQFVSYSQMNISIGPESTVLVSVSWHFTASGNNTISVIANQHQTIPESSYAGDTNSTVFYVEPNLPDLVILSSGITFNPSPAYSGKKVAITAAIQNFLGRAGASDVTVAFYYGNPHNGGTLIAKSIMNISAGGSNTTSVSWTPTTIGQIPVYVYIDPQHQLQQYSTSGNLNDSVLTVYLSTGGQDLVVNDTNSNYSSPFTIPAQLNLSSNVIVTQSGYLAITGGGLNFIETYGGEYSFLVNQTGELLIQNSYVTSTQLLNLYVYGNARLIIENSVVGANVNIILGGNSVAWINSSTVKGTVQTAAFSYASVSSSNTTFSNQLTVGYNEIAKLYNVSVPYVAQQSGATVYIYRWIYVTVFGPSGTTIADSNVTLYTFSNLTNPYGNVYAKAKTNVSGAILFAGLSDTMKGGSDTYSGNYVINTSYYDATMWYAPELTISLAHYTAPLLQSNINVISNLNIQLPDLVLSSANLVFSSSPLVEGSQVTVDVLVFNLGYGSVTSNFTVTFNLPGSSPVNVTTSLLAPLTVNSAVPLTATWNIPMSYGNMTVSAAVNLNRNVTEISYTNNLATRLVDVLSLPHLSPIKMNATGTDQEFSSITFNVIISNSGQTGATNVPVEIVDGTSAGNLTTAIANGTLASIGAGATGVATVIWTVPQLPSGSTYEVLYFAAVVNPHDTVKESSYSQNTLPQAISLNISRAQVNARAIISPTSVKAGSDITVTVTVTSKLTGKPMANYPLTVVLYNIRGSPQTTITSSVSTGQNGLAVARIVIPQTESQGSYHFEVFSDGQYVSSTPSFNVSPNGSSTGIPLMYWLLIIVIAVGAFAGFSAYLYRYGLARVVECGNCGAFIPETSKKCPYCSVEFEPGTSKCSNCSSWIPASSKECPICGVKFADEGEGDQEDEATTQLRKQYAAFADKFRAQAKAELGSRYTDKAFLSWWRKQPTYVTFENWLSRQQQTRRARMITCPVCGEPNPQSSKECVKCGSQLMSEPGRKDGQPPSSPPQGGFGKVPPQEPKKVVVPKRIIRRIDDKPEDPANKKTEDGKGAQ